MMRISLEQAHAAVRTLGLDPENVIEVRICCHQTQVTRFVLTDGGRRVNDEGWFEKTVDFYRYSPADETDTLK